MAVDHGAPRGRSAAPVPRLDLPPRPGPLGPLPPGLLIGALLLVPVVFDSYWTFQVTVGLTLAISCLGLQMLLGMARQISLMHAGVVGASLS